ncbi:TonB-dependent receptor [Flavobacterium sp. NRK F10]|uniref:TonB-dependent receptor n=1 Tax=Flavobacterium sp. NRK F10 TaxID=2954931 RepID=UPI002091BB20|nr:TonB-dependent receptor [Flavobacterium sp. NRK F10]MCO6173700.1 TonB-dependent receptor [Flavobacterium sp. NRK F10]
MKRAFLFLISLLSVFSFGQNFKGIVVDVFSLPVADVYVYNLSSEEHSHTNELGKFSLMKANVGDTLKFSKLGFKSVSFSIRSLEENITVTIEEDVFNLSEIILMPDIDINSNLTKIDLTTNPVNSSQEVLRKVPGLFIGQHAGGGKAEQLFLRGYDVDHGTDVVISVDGIPVNMVSHAHGQGYSDLHFVIPETIEDIDFGKGPYEAAQGNFATAGYVNFETKERLDKSRISMEVGQFNTLRTLGMFDLLDDKQKQTNAYLATEYIMTDGPFDSPQNFNRFNIFGKYNTVLNSQTKIDVLASYFKSKWDASGQIPMRLVESGAISRFGSVDDTEGGFTSRFNLALGVDKIIDENSFVHTKAYVTHYDFTLFSNFTFFLEDPVNGDQIKQKEDRMLYGFHSEYNHLKSFNTFKLKTRAGIGVKVNSVTNSELSHTVNRYTLLNAIQLGDIEESDFFGYYTADFQFAKFTINPAVRLEYFKFNYEDKLASSYSNLSNDAFKVLPKLNISYMQNEKVVYFIKSGLGFHSNDTRVVLQQNKDILPTVYGTDIGVILKPVKNLIVNTALWTLFSNQEFVYVGDAGIVEPSGKSKRSGVDLSVRYQIGNYLFLDWDANYAYARSTEEPGGQNYIPLAPEFTSVGRIGLRAYKGFTSGLQFRYMGNRPANEDNSIVAEGYFVTDFNVSYDFSKNLQLGLNIQNLFDTDWNETQFLTESRLQNETESVEEIHFTPGTPFFAKLKLTYSF